MSNRDDPLVLHDYFAIRGGGERLVLTLAEAIGGRLMTGYRRPESYDGALFPANVLDLGLPTPLQRAGLRAAALAVRFRMEAPRVGRYRTRVFSGVAAPFAALGLAAEGRNIYYCHTPPRFLYDQQEHFRPLVTSWGATLKGVAFEHYRQGYEAAVKRMDFIIANSDTVRGRIRTYLGRDSNVIYPPCNTNSFVWRGQQDYYLSTARLASLKRVDKIVDAFVGLPSKRLVVASGGEEYDALRRRAANAPNITFVGWVDEDKLRQLIGDAIATIYVPVEEDFGMSPVESMAAGKPVIGVAEGGLTETILPEETGILLAPNFGPADIAGAVMRLTPQRAAAMRVACEARARAFSEDRFTTAMRELVQR